MDLEEDVHWIAVILELLGIICHGQSRDEAIGKVERLAIEVIEDRISYDELPSPTLDVTFAIPNKQLA